MTHRYTQLSREHDYDRNMRLALVAALLLVIAGFLALRPAAVSPYQPHSARVISFDAPPVIDMRLPEPPKPRVRPRLAIAAPDGGDVDPGITTGDSVFSMYPEDSGYVTIEIGRFIELPPKAVYLPKPEYPELCRRAGIGGKVTLKLLVEPDSSVSRVEIMAGSGSSLLDEAALRAARQARFRPGKQGIRPVRVWVAVPYVFELN